MLNRTTSAGLVTLLIANGFATWQFISGGGSIQEVLWVYWLQSVIIGIINIGRILTFPVNARSLTFNLTSHQKPITIQMPANFLVIGRLLAATFFTIHYGIFHIVYILFIPALTAFQDNSVPNETISISASLVLLNAILFAAHHIVTAYIERHQLTQHPTELPTLHDLMMRPYSRIIPMHVILIIGPVIAGVFDNTMVFLVFILLKVIVDLRLFYRGTSHPGSINASQPAQQI